MAVSCWKLAIVTTAKAPFFAAYCSGVRKSVQASPKGFTGAAPGPLAPVGATPGAVSPAPAGAAASAPRPPLPLPPPPPAAAAPPPRPPLPRPPPAPAAACCAANSAGSPATTTILPFTSRPSYGLIFVLRSEEHTSELQSRQY